MRERTRERGRNKEIKGANRGRKIIKAEFGEEKSGGGGRAKGWISINDRPREPTQLINSYRPFSVTACFADTDAFVSIFFFFFFYSTSRSGVLEFLHRLISNPLAGGYGAIDYRVSNQRKGSFLLPWPSAPVQPRNRITPALIPSPFLDSLSFQRRPPLDLTFRGIRKWIRPSTRIPSLCFFLLTRIKRILEKLIEKRIDD